MADTCPTCGTDVTVIAGDEGTSSYEPVRQSFYIAGYERAEAALTTAFDHELTRRIRAEDRVEQLERAIQLAFNHAEKWSVQGMQDHLWRSLKGATPESGTVNVPNRDAEHPATGAKENFRLSGLTERKDGEREELMRELTRETERLGLYEWQDDQPEKKGDTDG